MLKLKQPQNKSHRKDRTFCGVNFWGKELIAVLVTLMSLIRTTNLMLLKLKARIKARCISWLNML